MIRTKITKLHLSPICLHSASSVRIPSSVNNFRDMLPTIRLSPLGSPIIRKNTIPYNAFKRPGMYPNVSKCNAKRCVCCTHLCTKSTNISSVNGRQFSIINNNASDTEAAFLDLHLSISNGIVSTKIYDKRDDFDFEIVNFPFLDGDVPRSTSYGVYISQLIRFARASSYVTDFNTRNKLLTQKLLKQGYRYHKLRKTFSKFYRRYFDLISKFQVGLKSLLRQGLSEPDFYGDLVYKLKKIVGSNNFSAQFIKIISHYKKIGYNINVLQQTACLVVNPITVGNFAFLFNCTLVGRTSDSMMVPT